ncbi:hypothetical protein SORBI_3001G506033 [Sorghum bicolor]|jgi:hypothetical protein|uniref:Uncharacterized protein n=1 Tax=Sorghum bicolor TaxID=4558 RepID=A0A1Z5SBE3_SORBI|nr:hypothetical protein SORBI_3001G506033 [Sorghum bicolor]
MSQNQGFYHHFNFLAALSILVEGHDRNSGWSITLYTSLHGILLNGNIQANSGICQTSILKIGLYLNTAISVIY